MGFKELKRNEAKEKINEGRILNAEGQEQVTQLTQIDSMIQQIEVVDDADLSLIEEMKAEYKAEGLRAHKEITTQIEQINAEVESINAEIAMERGKVEHARNVAERMSGISEIGRNAADRTARSLERSASEYQNMESDNLADVNDLREQEKRHQSAISSLF